MPNLLTTMPDTCYVFIHATPGARVGRVRKGAPGWQPTRIDERGLNDREARCLVNLLNNQRGVAPTTAERMLQLACQGWRTPHLEVVQ